MMWHFRYINMGIYKTTHLTLEVGLRRELLVHDADVVLQAVLLRPPLPAKVAHQPARVRTLVGTRQAFNLAVR